MHVTVTLATLVAVALIHFSYVDFRFRHRDGIWWYWLLRPAPVLMWVSRAAIVADFAATLSMMYFGPGETIAIVIVGLMLLHIASLVLVEILEPR